MKICFTNEREMSAKRTKLLNVIRHQKSAGKGNKMRIRTQLSIRGEGIRLSIGRYFGQFRLKVETSVG